MKTLADMTPGERPQCRGMWCDTPKGTFVLLAPMFRDHEKIGWQLVIPSEGMKIDYQLKDITPRPDLPRAWQADGTPPAGKWEHAERLSKGVTTVYLCGKENPTHRRWKGEWEEA